MYLMKPALLTGVLGALALPAIASPGSCGACPPTATSQDVSALEYAYAVQDFLYQVYRQNGAYSADDFSSFPNASMIAANGESLAANIATNMNGLQQQAMLGVEALKNLGSQINATAAGYMMPKCSYTYPPSLEKGGAMQFVMTAYYIEATLCGAFIGLADYVQNPESAFLMARLSAEHGIHGSFLGSYMNPTPYSAMSMALTPAFTPEHVLMVGSGEPNKMNVGYLGKYIPSSCAPMPQAPCGGEVMIGNLTAAVVNGGGAKMGANGTAGTGAGAGASMGANGGMPYGSGNGSMAASPTGAGANGTSYTGPYESANAASKEGLSLSAVAAVLGGVALQWF